MPPGVSADRGFVPYAESIRRIARRSPHREAVVLSRTKTREERVLTYAQFTEHLDALERQLEREGVRSKDAIAYVFLNEIGAMLLNAACADLGLIAVPLNPALDERALLEVLESANPALFVGSSSLDLSPGTLKTLSSGSYELPLLTFDSDSLLFARESEKRERDEAGVQGRSKARKTHSTPRSSPREVVAEHAPIFGEESPLSAPPSLVEQTTFLQQPPILGLQPRVDFRFPPFQSHPQTHATTVVGGFPHPPIMRVPGPPPPHGVLPPQASSLRYPSHFHRPPYVPPPYHLYGDQVPPPYFVPQPQFFSTVPVPHLAGRQMPSSRSTSIASGSYLSSSESSPALPMRAAAAPARIPVAQRSAPLEEYVSPAKATVELLGPRDPPRKLTFSDDSFREFSHGTPIATASPLTPDPIHRTREASKLSVRKAPERTETKRGSKKRRTASVQPSPFDVNAYVLNAANPEIDEPWTYLYTSGTTSGKSKGCIRTQRQLIAGFLMHLDALKFPRDDPEVFMVVWPVHGISSFFFSSMFLYFGQTVLLSTVEPRTTEAQIAVRFMRLLENRKRQVTFTTCGPRQFQSIIDAKKTVLAEMEEEILLIERKRKKKNPNRLYKSAKSTIPAATTWPGLSRILLSGAPASAEFKKALVRFVGNVAEKPCEFVEAYGSTEAGIVTFLTAEMLLEAPGTVGIEPEGQEISRFAKEGLNENESRASIFSPNALGARGPIYVRGPMLFSGYVGIPDSETFAIDPKTGDKWFATGDVGERDLVQGKAFLRILGRVDDRISFADGTYTYPVSLQRRLMDRMRLISSAPLPSFMVVDAKRIGTVQKERVMIVMFERPSEAAATRILEASASLPVMGGGEATFGVRFVPDAEKTSTGKIDRAALYARLS